MYSLADILRIGTSGNPNANSTLADSQKLKGYLLKVGLAVYDIVVNTTVSGPALAELVLADDISPLPTAEKLNYNLVLGVDGVGVVNVEAPLTINVGLELMMFSTHGILNRTSELVATVTRTNDPRMYLNLKGADPVLTDGYYAYWTNTK